MTGTINHMRGYSPTRAPTKLPSRFQGRFSGESGRKIKKGSIVALSMLGLAGAFGLAANTLTRPPTAEERIGYMRKFENMMSREEVRAFHLGTEAASKPCKETDPDVEVFVKGISAGSGSCHITRATYGVVKKHIETTTTMPDVLIVKRFPQIGLLPSSTSYQTLEGDTTRMGDSFRAVVRGGARAIRGVFPLNNV